jgi:hypothetical protein
VHLLVFTHVYKTYIFTIGYQLEPHAFVQPNVVQIYVVIIDVLECKLWIKFYRFFKVRQLAINEGFTP